MDIFLKNKFLLRLILLLIVLNLFSVFYIWMQQRNCRCNKLPNRNIEGITAVLKDKLQLTDNQVISFKNIREDFFSKEEKLSKLIKSQRDTMNAMMFNQNTDTIYVKSIARRVADNEYQMELLRFEQAKVLKEICTPEQMEKFKGLVKEIRDYLKPENQQNK
ncbi:MAG: Spy/CpxP family protein refolding chaperone [Bacteroidetes bacterium]|nr:Spy/CpxP family protein refolding chaperone [Bacteroidota bacterium]